MAEPSLQVQGLILYGSKARQDDTPESDIDLLLIVTDDAWPIKEHLLTIGSRLSLEHDVIFNLMVVSQTRWAWMEEVRHPLYRAIAAEGVALISEILPAGENPKMTWSPDSDESARSSLS